MTLRGAVITVSDRSFRGERPDASGPVLRQLLEDAGVDVVTALLLPDDAIRISAELVRIADAGLCQVICTTGGTGLSPRDVTPEATAAVIDRRVPGMEEAIRQESLRKTPLAMLSRAIIGVRRRTLILNFPGSPKAVAECFAVVAPVLGHAVTLLRDEDPHVVPVADAVRGVEGHAA